MNVASHSGCGTVLDKLVAILALNSKRWPAAKPPCALLMCKCLLCVFIQYKVEIDTVYIQKQTSLYGHIPRCLHTVVLQIVHEYARPRVRYNVAFKQPIVWDNQAMTSQTLSDTKVDLGLQNIRVQSRSWANLWARMKCLKCGLSACKSYSH